MGLSNELSCEAGSFSHPLNPHRFFQSEVLRLYFLALEPWVLQSVSLLSCSSRFIRTLMWDYPVFQPLPCHVSSLPWLPVSAPPTCLDECFFNSLVVRLPYSSISVSSGCSLFLNLLLCFFWLCDRVQYIYLCLHLGWKFCCHFLSDNLREKRSVHCTFKNSCSTPVENHCSKV